MSDNLSCEDAQRLFNEMSRREKSGCTCSCLSRVYWFTKSSSGCDVRSPADCVRRYFLRKYGHVVTDGGAAREDVTKPRWSKEHPYVIEEPTPDEYTLEAVYRYEE